MLEKMRNSFLRVELNVVFTKRVQWADQIEKGDEVYVDGILKRIDKDHVLMSPVGLRDPGAAFNPMKK